VKDPIPKARELIAQARIFAREAREEAMRLHYVPARKAESRALLRCAAAAENFAEKLGGLTDAAEHQRPLLPEEEII
jgi:hypothetical protein